ncbi:PREDICTED: DNA polymerase epsilon subunit 3-like [Amphimedon queenslandica]|uniref:DNA polymerase epsilon subunit 3 n=1 Tax=Amphimedon queenslandica TaxID=400682 RepID=A0A1X7VB98_AMPQE|nr:PREDICTED: DNA polymerase epsilon subunit 3-like [Amphimedon queenslandica]|eukprot:XP_003385014.1 PREDICTED: DNA polymerase epsilon subunit 3-like [Amphimedon queenslandica]
MAENLDDINFPASSVARIIKEALPEGVNVSKEAKAAIGRAASIFVLYATSCANNYTSKAKRKTIIPSDIFSAAEDMEFQEFVPEMKESLEAFKKSQKEKKDAAADRKRKQQQQQLESPAEPPPTTSPGFSVPSEQDVVAVATVAHDNSGEGSKVQEEEMETEEIPNETIASS